MSSNDQLVRPALVLWSVVVGTIFGVILLGLNYTYLFWRECKKRRREISKSRNPNLATDPEEDTDSGWNVCYIIVPNLLTFAAFGVCVSALALRLKASGTLLWYIVVTAAVATGTATMAIVCFYIYMHCKDLLHLCKRNPAKRRRKSKEEAERLLGGDAEDKRQLYSK